MRGLNEAIKVAGSQSKLAQMLDVDRQLVHAWTQRQVPAQWCGRIEAATGIPRSQLRPDLFAYPAKPLG